MEGNTLLVLTRPLIMKLERQWAGFFMINRDYVEFSMAGARLGLCLSVKLFYDINEWFQMHAVKIFTAKSHWNFPSQQYEFYST